MPERAAPAGVPLTTDLSSDEAIPYFLWDQPMTVAELIASELDLAMESIRRDPAFRRLEVGPEGDDGESGYNARRGRSKPRRSSMKHDLRDLTLRALILVAGGLSALLLALKGHGEALPAVAVGGALGAFFATRVQQTSEE